MLKHLQKAEDCRSFAEELRQDASFSDPMTASDSNFEHNLFGAFARSDEVVLGVYRERSLIGLFVFLLLDEEKYAEMIVGLSREETAYAEIFDWLRGRCAGFLVDFVFNPSNRLLRSFLERERADFDTEQLKMTLSDISPASTVDTSGVEPLSEKTMAQYLAMHNKDMYWTGEKVAAAPDHFRTLVALDGDTVVGYLDVTNCFDENEPYDLYVKEEYRRRGWGRRLLARAIMLNRPNAMMLLVEVDNAPAIRLYSDLGFAPVPGQNSLTAHWRLE